jgi:hypothetical protein
MNYGGFIMRRLLVVLFVSMFFTGCQQANDLKDQYYKEVYRTSIYYGDFSQIKKVDDIPWWIRQHIQYHEDVGEDIVPLAETVERGYGDCEERALMYLNILYIKFGIKGEFCMVDSSRSVGEGGYFDHAIVRVNGVLIEPKYGTVVYAPIAYYYSFDEIFY